MKCRCHSHNGFLTSRGYRDVAQRELEIYGVDGTHAGAYVDKVGSVSGLRRDEDLFADVTDQLLLEQSERFHNGS